MRNRTIKSFTAIFLAIALFSCGKDDDKTPTYQKENPLAAYLTATGFSEVSSNVDDGDYEFGLSFIPKVDGQISEIVVKLPGAQTNLRVTIWDAATKGILRTETIAAVVAEVQISKTITALALTKNKEYMITFQTNDWYEHDHPEGTAQTYPITAGNISITGYGYNEGTTQTYPTSFQTDYYAGDLSFVFQRTK